MDQQPTRKATPASWRPGVSGNPRGRPAKGAALTDAIRAKVDPAELVDIALELARSGKQESTRIAALSWLQNGGYTKPAEKHELAMGTPGDDADDDYSSLTLEQLREVVELDRKRAAILAANGDPRDHHYIDASSTESTPTLPISTPAITPSPTRNEP